MTPSFPEARKTERVAGLLLVVSFFIFGFAQLIAFFQGLHTGFGLGGAACIGIFTLLYLVGSVGSIPMAMSRFMAPGRVGTGLFRAQRCLLCLLQFSRSRSWGSAGSTGYLEREACHRSSRWFDCCPHPGAC